MPGPLTPDQIAVYAYRAGFRGEALLQAIAIALRESGGNPAAYNPELGANTPAGGGSRGLWQIYGTAHPEYNNAAMFDPQQNANAAYAVYRQAGNKFTPWTTFTLGLTNALANSREIIQAALRAAGGGAVPMSQYQSGIRTPQPLAGALQSGAQAVGTSVMTALPGGQTALAIGGAPNIWQVLTDPKQKTGLIESAANVWFILAGMLLIFFGLLALIWVAGKQASPETISEVAKLAAGAVI